MSTRGTATADVAKFEAEWKKLHEDHITVFDRMKSSLQSALDKAIEKQDLAATAAKYHKDEVERIDEAYDALFGTIDESNAVLDLADAFDNLQTAATESLVAAGNGEADAEQRARAHQRAINDLKAEVAQYGREVLKLPPEKVTKMLGQIDRGSVAAVEAELNQLARARWAQIGATFSGPSGTSGSQSGTGGKKKAEAFTGGRASFSDTPAGGTVMNVTINGARMTPAEIVSALKDYQRRNGPL